MSLHLIKLAAGVETLNDLRARQAHIYEKHGQVLHITRMTPKRRDELLEDGSLYWVIKRKIRARQKILDIESFTDGAGIGRCKIILKRNLILTRPSPRRPFQGWRYFKANDAPADLPRTAQGAAGADMPDELREELINLGLL